MKGIGLGVIVLAGVVLALAGCGGSKPASGVAHISSSASAGATGGATASGGGSSPENAANPEQAALAYSHCMRSSGVPNFPDPKSGSGLFRVGAGTDPQSPSFRSAQAKCQKLMPGGGPGSGPPPSAQTLARFLRISQCMRKHGVPEFPDPRTTAPPLPAHQLAGGHSYVISDIEGVILVMGSIDEQSPQFTRAAAACAFPLHNH